MKSNCKCEIDMSPEKQVEFGKSILESHFPHIAASGVIMLNSGSFGIAPKCVIDRKIQFVLEFESYGDQFVRQSLFRCFAASIEAVADLLNLPAAQCTLVDNVTTGVSNLLSLYARDGDAILVNSWTYGAVKMAAQLVGEQMPAGQEGQRAKRKIIEMPISLPLTSQGEIVDRVRLTLEAHPEIKVAIFDHITSGTACVMPVRELARLCRSRGVLVIIDGAHAIGQIPGLDIAGIDADCYVGNLHKWLFAPKSAALVWASAALAGGLRPAVVSWLVGEPEMSGRFAFLGTRDVSSVCAVREAVAFVRDVCGGLERIHAYCTQLADEASQCLTDAWGTRELPIPREMRAPYLRLIEMPAHLQHPDILEMTKETKMMSPMWNFVLNKLKIDVLLLSVEGRLYIRISCALIVSMADIRQLADAVMKLRKKDLTG